ncbi:unnamed protein product [Lactuca virosa]|uniref:Uncharacterized protein n=1 Tax=Lactuca virosa TaxID=75947 RepID=A0AAU9NFT7_9ASTR|nr:unnamed protein product [Lactuca virosa]
MWHLTDELANETKATQSHFFGLHEPFSGLNEMDFELHGIYMDHEPEQEFVTQLDKCKGILLNVILTDENLRNSSMADKVRTQVYHVNGWQSDEDEQEHVKNK